MIAPEIKIAIRFAEKHKLEPPVDVVRLVSEYAHIEETNLPIDADAISINLKKDNKKPSVFINKSVDSTRKRFTYAHELAHIIIPWHVGTVISHVTHFETFTDDIYKQIEAEANRFASEILLPTKWLKKQIRHLKDNPIDFIKKISGIADTSVISTTISVCNLLPQGYVFAILSNNGKVIYSGRSKDTVAPIPSQSDIITNIRKHYEFASTVVEEQIGMFNHVWWHFGKQSVESTNTDNRDWHEILDTIIIDCKVPKDDIKHTIQSINGIIGAANGMHKDADVDGLYSIMLQRFSSRDHLTKIARHPDFKIFIIKRVLALRAK